MGKQRGRPPSNPPKLAFEVRRYLTLVQVLAVTETREWIPALEKLCEAWGVEPAREYLTNRFDFAATLQKLAKHVIEYHRGEGQ